MYTDDTAVIPIAGKLIIILALYQIFDAIQLASRSSLLGLKDINIPTVFSAISYYAICLPCAYLLGFTAPGSSASAKDISLQSKVPPGLSVPFGRVNLGLLSPAVKFLRYALYIGGYIIKQLSVGYPGVVLQGL